MNYTQTVLMFLALFTLQIGPVNAREPQTTETDRLNTWLDQKYHEESQFSPLRKALFGVKDEDTDRVDDFSVEGFERVLNWRKQTTTELRNDFTYEELSDDGKDSYDFWVFLTERAISEHRFRSNGLAFSQVTFSPQHLLNQLLISWHQVSNRNDMEDYISRIRETSRALTQLIERSEAAAKKGMYPPDFVFEIVLHEAQELLDGKPFKDEERESPVWADVVEEVQTLVKNEKIEKAEADELLIQARTNLVEHWGPAQRALITWLKRNRKNALGFRSWLPDIPEGKKFYAERLAYHTTTELDAAQIHAIGLANVARLHSEIVSIMDDAGFEGSLQSLFKTLQNAKDDPRFYYPNSDEGRQAFLDESTRLIRNLEVNLHQFFGLLPKADLVVKRVEPYREQAGAAAHYNPSSVDGSRPAVYYAHLIDMTSNPKYDMEALAYHEALPGHHMQYGIANELKGVPEFRKRTRITAYGEGWALYAEGVAAEMSDTYQDPYAKIGRLNSELFRAVRLVVDTGLHAEGWSGEKAVRYMIKNSITPSEMARSEIRRYIADPGQATAYMIGMLKLREFRERAQDSLAERFDIRDFHNKILERGHLPLGLLERKIDRWISEHL